MFSSFFEEAGRLDPDVFRNLDALDLAAALRLGGGLGSISTDDDRLAGTAQSLGIPVIAPCA